jgi:hypothetical protein
VAAFLKKDRGGIVARIGDRFYRQIGAVILCTKLTAGHSFGGSRVLILENRYGNIDTEPRFRDGVSSPFHRCGNNSHWDGTSNNKRSEQPARQHAETSEFVLI